jgi:hypothetical protein
VDQAVTLEPLLCLKCGAPVPAEPDQVAWVCAVCGQGLYLDDEQGLKTEDIYFSTSLTPNTPGKPFWVADGVVNLQRETFGSAKNKDAQAFWSQPRRFFIPAYRAPLEELITTATHLLLTPPRLEPGGSGRFEPITLALPDVIAAAEFIVVSIEANRQDRLKTIDVKLELTDPILWILPA